ncbi:MAG: glycan-binding surface protein [Reichenbachiella sp.]
MKSIYRYKLILLITVIVGIGALGCSEEETGGSPKVDYIRVTDPAASDSLILSAYQGQMIAIMGENLGDVAQVWFNDLGASLDPSFITGSTIITNVPSQLPAEITNMMTMVFKNGDSLAYDFSVDISEPSIDRILSEYVVEGDIAVLYGDYFYAPMNVTFTGGVEGTLVALGDQEAHIQVPVGAEPGPITVMSNFGMAESEFWFIDNRGTFVDFNTPLSGDMWHPSGGASEMVPSTDDIDPIDGSFLYTKGDYGAWGWMELFTGEAGAAELAGMVNIPEDALINPAKYNFKFEVNSLEPLTGLVLNIYIGNNVGGANRGYSDTGDDDTYSWIPNVHTGGRWETITIPWEEAYSDMKEFSYDAAGYGISMVVQGPSGLVLDFGMDNLRVVPIAND